MIEDANRALRGKTALVCGASRGIGAACAREFARLGARVIVVARNEAALGRLRDEMGGDPHRAMAVDFSDPAAVGAMAERVIREMGTLHILLNNTGGPPSGPVLEASAEAFRAAFESHLICNQLLAQRVVPGMKAERYGRILNIISTSVKQTIRGLGVSNTIRGGVAAWSKTLAGELAPFGITVNNLLPGATLTDRLTEIIRERARASGRSEKDIEAEMIREIPVGRFGAAEEIAAVAGFLAGPSASYVTGVSVPVDGGRTSAL